MQQLDNRTNTTAEDGASLVIDAILLGMRAVRSSMRSGRPRDLSVPQFRLLAFVRRRTGASLSDAAEHIGLTLPSMSKAVNGMVKRGLMSRVTSERDRRCVTLALTDTGRALFDKAAEASRAHIATRLAALSDQQRRDVAAAAKTLRSFLADPVESEVAQ